MQESCIYIISCLTKQSPIKQSVASISSDIRATETHCLSAPDISACLAYSSSWIMQNFPTRQISEIGLVNSHCHTQHLQSDTFQTLIVSAAVSTLLLHTLPLLAREARCTTIPQSGRTRSWRSGTGRQLRDKRSRYLSTLVDNCQRISYLQACHNLDQHITQSFLSPPGSLIAIPTLDDDLVNPRWPLSWPLW